MKYSRNLVLASASLLVLLLLYGCVRYFSDKRTDSGSVILYSIEENAIDQFDFFGADGNEVTLVRQEDGWVWSGDRTFPINQNFLTTMLQKMGTLSVKRLIEKNPEDLAVYGLDSPSNTVTMTADEKEYCVKVGARNTANGDYYVSFAGSVYTVDETFFNLFSNTIYTMANRETLPDMVLSDILDVIIQNGGETLEFTAARDDGTSWMVAENGSTAVFADTSLAQSLLSGLPALRYEAMVSYKPTETQREDMGLTEAARSLTVVCRDGDSERTFFLTIGGATEDGASNYVEPSGSDAVYTVQQTDLSAFFGHSAEEYLTMSVAPITPQMLKRLTVLNGEAQYDFILDHEHNQTICSCNGVEITEASFNAFYYQLYALTAEKQAEQSDTAGDAFLTITYASEDGETTVRFSSYDANYDLAEVNGVRALLVNKQQVKTLQTLLDSFS